MSLSYVNPNLSYIHPISAAWPSNHSGLAHITLIVRATLTVVKSLPLDVDSILLLAHINLRLPIVQAISSKLTILLLQSGSSDWSKRWMSINILNDSNNLIATSPFMPLSDVTRTACREIVLHGYRMEKGICMGDHLG